MNSENSKIIGAKEVYSTLLWHAWSATIAIGLLLLTVVSVGISYVCGIVNSLDADEDVTVTDNLDLKFGLLVVYFLLILFHLFLVFVRYRPLREKGKLKPRSAKQKELLKALTPERYVIAGSILAMVLIGLDAYGLPILEQFLGQFTTIVVGLVFVTPLGLMLKEWGALSEHFERKPEVVCTAWPGYY